MPYFLIFPVLFVFFDDINTFFEEKAVKNLREYKKVVPLHRKKKQSCFLKMPRWRNR